jgi:hypothetical protein
LALIGKTRGRDGRERFIDRLHGWLAREKFGRGGSQNRAGLVSKNVTPVYDESDTFDK